MVPKNVSLAILCTLLMGWSGASAADAYRPDQFLGLDLSEAVLSPKRLGPAAEFEPVPVEARSDRDSEGPQARAEPTAEPRLRIQSPHIAEERAEKPRGAVRTKLAHRHGNPLDAQAFDARVQVWPCKSGGICSWKR